MPPDALPLQLNGAIDCFREAVANDRRVRAAFIGGSLASGTWDEHSDLDLYVIVDDGDYEAVFADRRSFLEAMGPVVLAEDFDGFGFDMVVFMLADGVEGELAFGRRSGFAHIHGGPYRVFMDRDGLLEGMTFPPSRPSPSQRRRSVDRTLAWFWRQLSLFATAAARGRAWTAYGYLEKARREALDLVWLLDAPGSWPGGFEKLEEQPGTERAEPIGRTLVDLDLDRQLLAAQDLAKFVTERGRRAAAAVGHPYPEALEAAVRRKIVNIETRRSTDLGQ